MASPIRFSAFAGTMVTNWYPPGPLLTHLPGALYDSNRNLLSILISLSLSFFFGFGYLWQAHPFFQFINRDASFTRLLFHSPHILAHPSGSLFDFPLVCLYFHYVNSIFCHWYS